ncbi:hypothetical protein L2E82_02548 [Cichorium intybus]|uniref:Uncharacterized protein n=1 Tax=Cichorium intybus TaxID=13427 RepID=A0ACB9H317_CICIN|nr:hypothetical protein L2E82_02548 [Cichorium intybus]
MRFLQIGLNKQENTKTSEFVNFSIREYVAEIRKKDRKKCWPFGSLGDPDKYDVFTSHQSVESSFLCSRNSPGKEASNSSNKETFSGKEDRSQTTDMIESLRINENMGKRINNGYPDSNSCNVIYKTENPPENSANGSDDDDEPGRNLPKRKHHRFRLLSDILTNLDNINTRCATETEDEWDDVTLDALFRKQMGVEVTTMSKKKMRTNRVEEPRFEKEEKSKCGSDESHGNDSDVGPVSGSRKTRIDDMDFQTMAKRKKVRPPVKNGAGQSSLGNKENVIGMQKDGPLRCRRKSNQCTEVSRTEPTETGNEDSEMEAVMLLATHFNEEDPSSPANGAKKAQSNMELEPPEASKLISSSSSGNKPSESGQDQGFATGTTCACIQKKIRAGNKSIATFYSQSSAKTATRDPKIYGAKVADNLTASVFQNRTTLVCSINRNPADFSIPNAENVFMRGG